MNIGKYVFAQIVEFLPKRYFERLVIKHKDRTAGMAPSYWSHMLVIMYGQLIGCHSHRELTDITIAHVEQHSGQWLVIVVLKVIFTTTGLCDVFFGY